MFPATYKDVHKTWLFTAYIEREEKAQKNLSPEDITDIDSDNGIFSVRGNQGTLIL